MVGSSGSGKTTVAAELAHTLGCPHVELDAIFHQPGWTPLETEAFRRAVRGAVSPPAWVVDGNYSAVRDLVWARADTVVFLDYPLHVVLTRLVPRTVMRTVRRTELWNGNREPMSNLWSIRPERSIIAWSITRHSPLRRRYVEAMVDPQWSHLAFVRLCSPSEVARFLASVPPAAAAEGATR
ncbi:MAG: adenylate kinase [Acidimicrobiales bacterium]